MDTQIAHISHTNKKGYVWRKRYEKHTIEIILRTRDKSIAIKRTASITIRYMELKSLEAPFTSMREMLKKFRDGLIASDEIERLRHLATASQEAPHAVATTSPMESLTLSTKRPQKVAQGHSLAVAKKAYFDANTEWKEKTIKAYSGCIDRFILWCANKNIHTVEEITKEHVISFKTSMDDEQLASMTKQKIITALGSMFNFILNVNEWIEKNPFKGMNYKKVSVEKPKEEITLMQFKMLIQQTEVKEDKQNYWANVLMYYTGMRVSELQQITKEDYIEIDGVKCISINTLEEGKSTKTETSKRNIPICDALMALNVWEEKPVMRYGLNSIMDKVSRGYKSIGLKRSSHCYRHSMSNRLRDTDTDDSTRAFILGHAAHGITDRVYITRLPLQKMLKALNDSN
ncbi:tyrosine-type recombinase/integrase [Escherichia coli]|nr:tyrosine-type recombinase/integrase [Escherichia coli]QMG11157.1 tyrosine-type recombinase/integrase [Escherichia coli]QMG15968.1 tyrosine-type recombinase/integrase [Escherichia coli]QMG25225.1 tyrosine-type recombinase/integrase [Escherichia coli]QMG30030.1 tyrosine-type recombinase/integrase [Escherichia coli]